MKVKSINNVKIVLVFYLNFKNEEYIFLSTYIENTITWTLLNFQNIPESQELKLGYFDIVSQK